MHHSLLPAFGDAERRVYLAQRLLWQQTVMDSQGASLPLDRPDIDRLFRHIAQPKVTRVWPLLDALQQEVAAVLPDRLPGVELAARLDGADRVGLASAARYRAAAQRPSRRARRDRLHR